MNEAITAAITSVEMPVFVKRKHELADLLKAVERGSKSAVAVLVDTMESKDATIGLKTRLECAKTLLDLQIKVVDQISKDQLTRQIAEIKANGLSKPLELQGEKKRLPPTTDFDTIQDV